MFESCEEEFLYAQVFPVLLLLSSLVTWQINSKHWQHYDNSLFTCPFYTYIITKPCAKTSRIKLHFTKLSKITHGACLIVSHFHIGVPDIIPTVVDLTEMTRYPHPLRASTCWKKTSAVPLTGGRKMIGHLMLFGPASYSDQTLLSSSSTII